MKQCIGDSELIAPEHGPRGISAQPLACLERRTEVGSLAVDDDPLEATALRILMLVLLGLTSACAGWDGQANLGALDDQNSGLVRSFYDLAGGEPTEEQCVVDGIHGDVGES